MLGVVLTEGSHFYTFLVLGGRTKRGFALNEESALNEVRLDYTTISRLVRPLV